MHLKMNYEIGLMASLIEPGRTDEKFTALHFASYHGNFELVKLMVNEMGANVNVTNVYGANCLHIAA